MFQIDRSGQPIVLDFVQPDGTTVVNLNAGHTYMTSSPLPNPEIFYILDEENDFVIEERHVDTIVVSGETIVLRARRVYTRDEWGNITQTSRWHSYEVGEGDPDENYPEVP